jgi:uncharacterized protein (DUF2249 family)
MAREFLLFGKWQRLAADAFLHRFPNHFHAGRADTDPFRCGLRRAPGRPNQPPLTNMNSSSQSVDPTRFDVRTVSCRVKHQQIFERWAALAVGQHFVLVNDHDPIPLYHQFAAQFPDAFTWEYLLRGPDEFQVRITRLAPSAATAPAPQKSSGPIDPATVFDVRPIPGRVKHAQIFQRWFDLPPGEYFVLLNDHDPVPLRYQFEAEFPDAFRWEYLETGPDEFRVKITKLRAVSAARPAPPTPAAARTPAPSAGGTAQEIDARGLEPPEPLIRILDALETLPAGGRLRAITDREPCHLFGEATQRGFRHECNAQPDGSWLTVLEHV